MPREAPNHGPNAIKPGPCDECTQATRCASERLACESFAMYTSGFARRRWESLPQVATAEQYKALMRSEDARDRRSKQKPTTAEFRAQREAAAASLKAYRRQYMRRRRAARC